MAQRAAPLMWRYSLQWCLPHRPCPGLRELLISSTAINKDQGDAPPGPPSFYTKGLYPLSSPFFAGAARAEVSVLASVNRPKTRHYVPGANGPYCSRFRKPFG